MRLSITALLTASAITISAPVSILKYEDAFHTRRQSLLMDHPMKKKLDVFSSPLPLSAKICDQ